MTKLEVLIWGIKHIAENHGFNSSTDWEEDGEVCIYGGCNVPTLSDVRMMCEDLGITPDFVESSPFGIDVFIPEEWYENESGEEYESANELWKRANVKIGA